MQPDNLVPLPFLLVSAFRLMHLGSIIFWWWIKFHKYPTLNPSLKGLCVFIFFWFIFELQHMLINFATHALRTKRKMLLKGIIPVIEDDLHNIEYMQCPEINEDFTKFTYIPCPRIRHQAAKYKIHLMFEELSQELTAQNQLLHRAASASGMTPDLESQNVEFRAPSLKTMTPDQKFMQDGGLYDCGCGMYGEDSPCEDFEPTIDWNDDSITFTSIPEQEYIECERWEIEEEIVTIQNNHRFKERRRKRQEAEALILKEKLGEESSCMIDEK
ncbi:hypothetical protein DSL72_000848 [Monilinia vaccinii-corymbosi]|uniref:Uncharacterized protein n=1 Tax=Monilinia vaccinii-corymbosi TaxID=61207 RepID=A0A8A3P061_9HELO|nr:hypothetical protein DSL72_000848 [Monilinia vaccinii-corymbosi]